VQNFTQLGGRTDFLRDFIWSRVSGLMRFLAADQKQQRVNGVNVCEELRRIVSDMPPSCPGLSLVTRAGFTVMTLRQSNNPPNGKDKIHRDRKRQDRRRACSSFSLISRELFTKEFFLADQTANSAYYCDVLRRLRENMGRLRPELWRQKNCCCITITHHLTLPFSPGNV
jgi:hypothetical protein